jgi:hypothetical protein
MKRKYYGARVKCMTCGTIIESKHVHDFVSCKCPERKKTSISIDGGGEYLRMIGCDKSRFKITRQGNYAIDDKQGKWRADMTE